jgi:hypothetical protein
MQNTVFSVFVLTAWNFYIVSSTCVVQARFVNLTIGNRFQMLYSVCHFLYNIFYESFCCEKT